MLNWILITVATILLALAITVGKSKNKVITFCLIANAVCALVAFLNNQTASFVYDIAIVIWNAILLYKHERRY